MKTQVIDKDLQNADLYCINGYVVDHFELYGTRPQVKDIKENWQYQCYIAKYYNYSDDIIENIIDKVAKYYN